MKKGLGSEDVTYTIEPKFDGLSVELLYETACSSAARRAATGASARTSRRTSARSGPFP